MTEAGDQTGPDFISTTTSTGTSTRGPTSLSSSSSSNPPPGHLRRTQTTQPHQQPRPRRTPSNSCTLANPIANRKSRCAEPGTSEIHAHRASFSIPPHSPNTLTSPRPLLPRNRRESGHSGTSDAWSEDSVVGDSQLPPAEDLHSLRNRLTATASNESALYTVLPEPSSVGKSSVSAVSDPQTRRLSGNSIYSLASARGVITPSTSAHGSELGAPPRSVPTLLPTGKGLITSQSEAELSAITVTTSSNAQLGQLGSGQHHLAPRDNHPQPLDLIRRNQRTETMQNSTTNLRTVDRSRSRAKRRFSGSTVTSSHSPSSDRAIHHREREEGVLRCVNFVLYRRFRSF